MQKIIYLRILLVKFVPILYNIPVTKTKLNTSITIAIPAYNEEENIEWVVVDALKSLPKYFGDFEIVAVDDGSTDKTGIILDSLAANHKTVRVIHQPNGGYSKAMLTGIMASKKDFVAYMPADGQFLVDDMRHCFEKMDKNDLTLGYRGSRPDYTAKRIIFSYGYLLLLLFLFGIRWIDIGWVNIWRTKEVQKLKINAAGGIFILTEIVVRFMRKGLRIDEAPSYYHVRKAGEVKNAKMKVVLNTFLSALKLWWEVVSGKA